MGNNLFAVAAASAIAIIAACNSAGADSIAPAGIPGSPPEDAAQTATPIKHLVVIFNENVSFDHYFATYPKAANPPGQPKFVALPGTPSVNGLSGTLLTANPN